jgi:1-aminocyclopropane-1-carboxylate deaminase/D-cysteine desulfhydrase-like pyridoxal-dependent ACC family enzyme
MLEKFERYPLTFGPTHIEKLERLGAYLGSKVELYAKREDCNSGLAFGGNKLRKLRAATRSSRSVACSRTTRAWLLLLRRRSA